MKKLFSILSVFLIGLVFVNVFFLYDIWAPAVPPIPPAPPQPKMEDVRAHGSCTDETMRRVRLGGPGEMSVNQTMFGEVRREPTAEPPPPSPPPPVRLPEVRMVLIGDRGKLALLDASLVDEGGYYKGHHVVDIQPTMVVLSGDYGTREVQLHVR